MENMDKGLTVSKWVLINRPKIPQNLSAQANKFGILIEKASWAFVVRDDRYYLKILYFAYLFQTIFAVDFIMSAVSGIAQILHVSPDQHFAKFCEVTMVLIFN